MPTYDPHKPINRPRPVRPGLDKQITAQVAESEPEAERLSFPDPEPMLARPTVTLSTVVEHRGRQITITATDMTVDQFCDLLDKRGFTPPAGREWRTLPDGTPICPKHGTPMRLREKQGDSWYSHRVHGRGGEELFCKGYAGKESPGFEH